MILWVTLVTLWRREWYPRGPRFFTFVLHEKAPRSVPAPEPRCGTPGLPRPLRNVSFVEAGVAGCSPELSQARHVLYRQRVAFHLEMVSDQTHRKPEKQRSCDDPSMAHRARGVCPLPSAQESAARRAVPASASVLGTGAEAFSLWQPVHATAVQVHTQAWAPCSLTSEVSPPCGQPCPHPSFPGGPR